MARAHGRFAGHVERALDEGRRALLRAGHYQGGVLRYAGEWHLGPDRFHYLEAQLRRAGWEIEPCMGRRLDRAPATVGTHGAPLLEVFFSFRSPYAYIGLARADELARRHGVPLRLKLILPMVNRGFEVPLSKRLYIVRDCAREARRHGLLFGRICDPLGAGVERCLAIAHRAPPEAAPSFAISAAKGIWSEGLDVADDEDLAAVVRPAVRGHQWHREPRAGRDDHPSPRWHGL